MTRELRRVSIVVLVMFVALMAGVSLIQVFQQDELRADERNARTMYDSYSAQRGPILVDGDVIARSVPSSSEYRYQRVYLEPELYAAATGYFTLNQGNTGVEGQLNEQLSGTANEQFLERLNAIFTGQEPQGAAAELTLDSTVQQVAWDALGDRRGAVVAYEPTSGRILALVSKPSFDPNLLAVHDSQSVIESYNELNTAPERPLVNRAIAGDLYPPGSTFKLVVTAAALERGDYEPDTEFANPGSLQLPQSSSLIYNAGGGRCGGSDTVTLERALALSCNIPFAELGRELGYAELLEQAEAFGFDETVEIPMSATPSVFPEVESDAQLMLSSFGQANVRTTPLQMAMVSAAIGNQGVLMQPQLVETITDPSLRVLYQHEPTEISRAMSEANAATLTDMMVESVANGVASNARIDGVDVAGKTGTAENAVGEPYTLWFTGFAPADDPQVAVAVVVEDGGGQGLQASSNQIAAPIARQVIEAVLNR